MDIIKRLTQERQMRHISQSAIADKLGLTITTIHRYETGQREISLNLAGKYANFVGFELKLIAKEEK